MKNSAVESIVIVCRIEEVKNLLNRLEKLQERYLEEKDQEVKKQIKKGMEIGFKLIIQYIDAACENGLNYSFTTKKLGRCPNCEELMSTFIETKLHDVFREEWPIMWDEIMSDLNEVGAAEEFGVRADETTFMQKFLHYIGWGCVEDFDKRHENFKYRKLELVEAKHSAQT